jgi:hypothetical protein
LVAGLVNWGASQRAIELYEAEPRPKMTSACFELLLRATVAGVKGSACDTGSDPVTLCVRRITEWQEMALESLPQKLVLPSTIEVWGVPGCHVELFDHFLLHTQALLSLPLFPSVAESLLDVYKEASDPSSLRRGRGRST